MQLALQGAHRHRQLFGHLLLARQALLEQLAQGVFDLQRQGCIFQRRHQAQGMLFQGAQQLRVGLAQWQLQVFHGRQQGRAALLEQHRAAKEIFVLFAPGVVRQRVLEPHGAGRERGVGDPARIQQPGGQHILHHVPSGFGALMAATPDQPHLAIDHLGAADPHVAHQFFKGHDAVHRLAQGRAVHGDVAQHAPRVGQDEPRRMQAEQGVAGVGAEVVEQAFVNLHRQAQAVVAQLPGLQAGSGQCRSDREAQLFGMAQVFEQRRDRGVAKGHGEASWRRVLHVACCKVI